MTSMQERLAIRMEIAMKTMMDQMNIMHREFEERMRRERQIMQTEIEAMIISNFGSSVHVHEEATQNATTSHKTMAVPYDIMAASISSDVPAASTPTTPLEMATDVTSALQLRASTANTSPRKLEKTTITTRRPEFAQESPTEQESSDKDLVIIRQLEPRKSYSAKNFRKKELAQRSSGQKAKCKSPHIDATAQNTNRLYQDAARNRQVLEEPRTEALKREDALEILMKAQLINLPEAHIEESVRYKESIARLAQSVERMRLVTSGFGCSPRWALLKTEDGMTSHTHDHVHALPLVY